MPQIATIKSLPRAFRMMKAMQAQGVEWGEDYQRAAGAALQTILAGRMEAAIDHHRTPRSRSRGGRLAGKIKKVIVVHGGCGTP